MAKLLLKNKPDEIKKTANKYLANKHCMCVVLAPSFGYPVYTTICIVIIEYIR